MSAAQRILVVEDEDLLAQNVKTFLGRSCSDVRVATSGSHAMELLETFTPDVLVLGYKMPGETGLDLYSEIMRRRVCPVGCVMITGFPLERISRSASEVGIHHLLSKPFSLAELQKLVDRSADEVSHHSH